MITTLRQLSYEDRLKQCKLLTLETRRIRGDKIDILKGVHGFEDTNQRMVFKVRERKITRLLLEREQCKQLDIRNVPIPEEQ